MCEQVTEERLVACSEAVVDLALGNVNAGGLPFIAVIVNQHGNFIGKGVNQSGARVTAPQTLTCYADTDHFRPTIPAMMRSKLIAFGIDSGSWTIATSRMTAPSMPIPTQTA